MDTKWKNSHRLGIAIIIFLVAAASAVTLGLYPYMLERAQRNRQSRLNRQEEQAETLDNLSLQVMNFSYEIWRQEQQEKEGKRLTWSQVFLPGMEEDSPYYVDLEQTMEEAGGQWESLYRRYSPFLSYAVEQEEGMGRSNVRDPKIFFSSPLTEGQIQFRIHFTESGQLEILDIEGEENAFQLEHVMNRFEFYDPLEERLGDFYRDSDVFFQGPKDMTLVFRCDPMAVAGISSGMASERSDYPDAWEYDYFTVCAPILLILGASALALPAVKSLGIGTGSLCRLSFEPLSMIGFIWLWIMEGEDFPRNVIACTMSGAMQTEFETAGFLPGAAKLGVLLVNLAFWICMYGLFYWGVTSYRAIFSMGPWLYFKERTWLGRFLRFIKRWCVNALNVFNETDWEKHSTRIIGKAIIANFLILTLISCLWFWGIGALVIYSVVLFILLNRYWGQMQKKYDTLLEAINRIAQGDLDVEIQEDIGIFNPFKEQLGKIQNGFRKAVDQEVKSERTKTELITNVSHDLKTPLTAIITYVNLLKQEGITDEERASYIQVLDQKSMRLKALIEDLFEVSKASSGAVKLHLTQVDIVSLLKQVLCELSDKIEASGVEFRCQFPEERILLQLDSQKTYRIFENLLVNVVKYAMKGTRAYIQIRQEEDHAVIRMRNVSAEELTVPAEELSQRFVRGDSSRNTEGSGLGLAIADSFVSLQGGQMKLETEDDLFKVTIRWKIENEKTGEEIKEAIKASTGEDTGTDRKEEMKKTDEIKAEEIKEAR